MGREGDSTYTPPEASINPEVFNGQILREKFDDLWRDYKDYFGIVLHPYIQELSHRNPEKAEIYHDLPDILHHFLWLAGTTPGVEKGTNYGSVGRSIIQGGMHPNYWPAFFGIHDLIDEYAKTHSVDSSLEMMENVEEANRFLSGFLSSPDNDITFIGSVSEIDIAKHIFRSYNIDFSTIEIKQKYIGGKTYECIFGDISLDDNFLFTVKAGPVETNPSIRVITATLVDRHNGKALYHFDLSPELKDPRDIVKDKRTFGTSSWESERPTLHFNSDEEKITWSVSTTIEEALRTPIKIYAKQEDFALASEVAVRTFRMILFHAFPDIELSSGEKIMLPNLEMMLPYFESDSLLGVRKFSRTVLPAVERVWEEIGIYERNLIMREVFLGLQVDPYITIQAFRDTGFALLTPGLHDITHQQWDDILRSVHMVVQQQDPTRKKYTYEEIQEERLFYLNNGYAQGMDGVKRFLKAVKEVTRKHITDDPIEGYLSLWKETPKKTEKTVDAILLMIRERLRHTPYEGTTEESLLRSVAAVVWYVQAFPGVTDGELEDLYKDNSLEEENLKTNFAQLLLASRLLGFVHLHKQEMVITKHGKRFMKEVTLNVPCINKVQNSVEDLVNNTAFRDFCKSYKAREISYYSVMKNYNFLLHLGIPTIEAMRSLTKRDVKELLELPQAKMFFDWKEIDAMVNNIYTEIQDMIALFDDYKAL